VKRLFIDGPAAFFLNPELLFLPLFGVIASVRAAFWRDSAFKIPALWMMTLILMFNFASPTLASYTPLVLLHRYLVPVLLPAAVLTAGLLVRLWERDGELDPALARERRFWGTLVAAALVVVGTNVTVAELRDRGRVQPMYELRDLSRRVTPQDVVYADPLSRKGLEFYWKYPASTKLTDFEGLDASAIQPGSYVVVDTNRLQWLSVNVSMWLTKPYGYHAPSFAKQRPPAWKPVWRNAYSALYKVD
jgi:hypothetical protein